MLLAKVITGAPARHGLSSAKRTDALADRLLVARESWVRAALAIDLDALDQRAVELEERRDHRNLIHALVSVVLTISTAAKASPASADRISSDGVDPSHAAAISVPTSARPTIASAPVCHTTSNDSSSSNPPS